MTLQLRRRQPTTASRARRIADASDLNSQPRRGDIFPFRIIGEQTDTGGAGRLAVKRTIDVVASVLGLLLLSPLLMAVAAVIKLDSSGPVFFTQGRIGRGFRPFSIYKFRTMVKDAPRIGKPITIGADARITRIGRFLRRTKLDELPQLINVVKGDMSLVGPRPELPRYVEKFADDYREILTVRPGMTDLASLKYVDESAVLEQAADPEGEYVTHVLPEKLELAKQYVRGFCLLLDLALIARTVVRIVRRESASALTNR